MQTCNLFTYFLLLDLECEPNMYGVNCTGSCGHCQGSSCHHVNGTCLTGCSPGYQGRFCRDGKKCKQNVLKCDVFYLSRTYLYVLSHQYVFKYYLWIKEKEAICFTQN